MQAPTYKGEAMLLRWSDNSTNGRTVTFTIEDGPDSSTEHPFKGLHCGKGGQRFAIVAVPLGESEHPNFEKPTEHPKPRQSWGSMSYAQRSGILRNDKRFQEWLGVDNPDDAADIIRRKCGVESCSKIDGIPLARQKFEVLDNQYRTATGLMAENRA